MIGTNEKRTRASRTRLWQTWSAALMLTLVFCLACGFLSISAHAATSTSYKKINSVTLHVKSELEAGDFFSAGQVINDEPEDGEVGVWVSSTQYEITDLKLMSGAYRSLSMGQTIELRVILSILDTDTYRFKSEFTTGNVSISGSGATCTSVTRSNTKLTLTIQLNPIKGQYEAPDEVWWSETRTKPGLAKWDAVKGASGYYDLQLRRGGTIIKEVSAVTDTSYDFYPYMTVAGKYTVRVRTVPHSTAQKSYAKSSAWTVSDSLTIAANEVSDGTGAVWDDIVTLGADGTLTAVSGATGGQAGWLKNNGYWYYKYPNGSFRSNGWELIGGIWYAFDESGRMRTGWYQAQSGTYYLDANGAMVSGWQYIGGYWYYFDPDTSSAAYGHMLTNTRISSGERTYYLGSDGRMATGWTAIGEDWYYFRPGTGEMLKNTWVDTFYLDENGVWRH